MQGCHYSTLVQQILSIIAQRGGATAGELWRSLVATGPFSTVAQPDFLMLLRAMGEHDLVLQESSGLLLPGESGERFINHYDFYSAFISDEEFRLVCDGKALGSLPVSRPLTSCTGRSTAIAFPRWSGSTPNRFGPISARDPKHSLPDH